MRVLKFIVGTSLALSSSLGYSLGCVVSKDFGQVTQALVIDEATGHLFTMVDGYSFDVSNIGNALHMQILDSRNANVYTITHIDNYTVDTEVFTTLNADRGHYVLTCN